MPELSPERRALGLMLGAAAGAALLSACDFGAEEEAAEPRWEASAAPGKAGSDPGKAPDVCGAPLDTNRNGIVEEPEWLSFGNFAFEHWDRDDDQKLSPAEFHVCWRALGWGEGQPVFVAFDDDGDGALTRSEFFAREEFEAWDGDDDLKLGPQEWPPA